MLIDIYGDKEASKIIKNMAEIQSKTLITQDLMAIRVKEGITLEQHAKNMKKSIKYVRIIENSMDDELTIKQIKEYIKPFNCQFTITLTSIYTTLPVP